MYSAKQAKVTGSDLEEGACSITEGLQIPPPPSVPTASRPTISSFVSNDTVLEAEVMWCLKTVVSHYSQNSCATLENFSRGCFQPTE